MSMFDDKQPGGGADHVPPADESDRELDQNVVHVEFGAGVAAAASTTSSSSSSSEPPGVARAAADREAAAAPPAASGEEKKKKPSPPSKPDLTKAFKTFKQGEYYFDEASSDFWLRNAAGKWIFLGVDGLRRHLKKLGLKDKPNVQAGENISQVDEEISRIEKESRVAYAGLLAGHKQGLRIIAGRLVLVSEDPAIITPAAGEWPILGEFFKRLLVGQEIADEKGGTVDFDQRPQFFAWLQHVVKCFHEGRFDSGLALCMAGGPDCGKSFLSLILRWILGGRVARPYDRMIGKDQFNKAEGECVLSLVDDDNQADTRLEARLKFAGEVKKIVANNEFQLRTMHKDGFAVETLRRLVVLVNLQLSRLMVLPPLDGDINDKIMLLRGYGAPMPAEGRPTIETPAEQACWPAPMPTRTPEEKQLYRERVQAELPAFLFWLLNEFKMPSRMSGGRFSVRHWHHPSLKKELAELSPHIRVWELIMHSECVLNHWTSTGADQPGKLVSKPDGWRGTAGELHRLLKSEASKLTLDEKREIPAPTWLGQRLTSCAEDFGEGVCRAEPTRTARIWVLMARKDDQATP